MACAVAVSRRDRAGGGTHIALARNAALAAAKGRFLLIIDDDEWPEPGWALALIDAQSRLNADAVFGPVLPRYEEGTPAMDKGGRVFRTARS
uniref:CAZy families GT2 protein n=1 Tax=uncultured Syntrophobacter sp. TaxID=281272 RepID=A0A060C348_9BACT|nr:CAZy families GT2 protein [uncultured Syntrophobacter sp.]